MFLSFDGADAEFRILPAHGTGDGARWTRSLGWYLHGGACKGVAGEQDELRRVGR